MRALLLTLTTCLLILPAQAQYSGGSGTAEDPYQIATAADLIALGEDPNDYDRHFILTADIDLDPNLPGGKVFDTPVIGEFSGVLEGNGFLIRNLNISGSDKVGLFSHLDGEVYDLGIVDANVTGVETVGILASTNSGTIANSFSTGRVHGSTCGGLVGVNRGTLTDCYSSATVSGQSTLGGLVGNCWHGGYMQDCHSTGNVSGTDNGVGGLVGSCNVWITRCYSTGNVTGGNSVGGLVGGSGGFSGCFATGTVSGSLRVGGLAGGVVGGEVRGSYCTGDVFGEEEVGALVGHNGYVHRDDEGTWRAETLIRDSYSLSRVNGSSQWSLIGRNEGSVRRCYGLSGIWGQPAADMNDIKTYLAAGWDFVGERRNGTEDIWIMPEDGYPMLRFFTGAGTAADPYRVYTADQLMAIDDYPDVLDKHFVLMSEIDMMSVYGHLYPYNRSTKAAIPRFRGTFDGNGHGVRWMMMSNAKKHAGLFGILEETAEVKNLRVEVISIDRPRNDSAFMGALAGENRGTISNCHSYADYLHGGRYVGGMVGLNRGRMTNCRSDGSTIRGDEFVGGLAGSNEGTIANCYSTGASVEGNEYVGALVGHNVLGEVIQSFWNIDRDGDLGSAAGEGKTTVEMRDVQTYLDAGWDFFGEDENGTEGTWIIREGGHWFYGRYPMLRIFLGAGTAEDPYRISTESDLYRMRDPNLYDKHFIVRSDIDLNTGWIGGFDFTGAPIPEFSGTFDGNGHVIEGLFITGENNLGLFGHAKSGATIQNLGIVCSRISGTGDRIGALVGFNDAGSTVVNCYSQGALSGNGEVGGLIGKNSGNVVNCYSESRVQGVGNANGGLVGENDRGTLVNCFSTGVATGDDGVGGLVGYNKDGSVLDCFWDIDVSGVAGSDGGTGSTTAAMQTAATFLDAGWDFIDETENGTDDIWWILEGQDYPRLWWEVAAE